MVQGLFAAAVSLAARRGRARKISRRLRGKDRRRLQAARRRQGAVEIPAPVRRGGAMSSLRFLLCTALLICTLGIHGASADPAFQAFLQSLWPQAQALGI